MMKIEIKFLRSADYDNILTNTLNEYENPFGLLKDIYQTQKDRNPNFIELMLSAIERGKQRIVSEYFDFYRANPAFEIEKQSSEYRLLLNLENYLFELEETGKAFSEQIEPSQKFERLQPIEKILIWHYLKFETLKHYQLGLKPGIFFLSRLLDINPESIKKPLSKIDDYTANKVTGPQARNYYPTLEKVKLFFDESDLKSVSKLIENRIHELKIISGNDF